MIRRKFIPGSRWLYFKIYTGIKTADEVATRTLLPLLREWYEAKLIDDWFFIRYTDPDFHLRLRLLVARPEQFIGFVQASQDAKISLERLNEIREKPDEEPEDGFLIRDIPRDADIEFRDAVFQYEGPHSARVLDGITLTIPHDKVTAIVGESGSGKTTLLKMMLGFYPPVAGEVLLGGRKVSQYSASCWRRACGTVMQESFVFSDTIANNIAVSDEIPDMNRVRRAVEVANIGSFIDSLPLGFNTRIGADGHGLSTGPSL